MKLFKNPELASVEVDTIDFAKTFHNEYEKKISENTTGSVETLFDCPPETNKSENKPLPAIPPVQFVIKDGDTGRNIYIYTKGTVGFDQAAVISNIISSTVDGDEIHLSLGSNVSKIAANVIISSIQIAKAKIIADCPLIGSIYTLGILCFCDEIVLSDYMFLNIGYNTLVTGGGIKDAKAALEFNDKEFNNYINIIETKGIFGDIARKALQDQRQFTMFGKSLKELLDSKINNH